ncbi:glutaminase [Sansalvadorimonas sp. 2012CJ34-2]|uniref:Glutaminase n=1 Tax=Parendozoicomonas callyspongiae TaxID=2942213 RepID=A0ABT0PE53_9GAMM|nr:glutaminase [Sansalvadorimonas sp. 2012CJ34-2]MCL6269588.1 glutaminase [Sansalvadorimonas sp. 2012CJ34-2]
MKDIDSILHALPEAISHTFGKGKPADYIPALAEVPRDRFGMAISTVDGQDFIVGDAKESFSIQSISKLFSLSQAMHYAGEKVFERVGVEPSGNPFNSLSQLEFENGIPRNPFINAGALVISDILLEHLKSPKQDFLDHIRRLSGNLDIQYDERVFRSEYDHGQRNAALAYYLKSFNNINHSIAQVLDFYFYQCSLNMSCLDLARASRFLANGGIDPVNDKKVVTPKRARRINSLMMTCGTYDEAGEFAFRVGLPCKSGVGGGIVAVIPGKMSICVWSPELGAKGNSLPGMHALKAFIEKAGISVF